MSDTRVPIYTITARRGRRMELKIEIFRKQQWTARVADKGFYRLRVNGSWHGGTHGDMEFFPVDEALALIKTWIADGEGK